MSAHHYSLVERTTDGTRAARKTGHLKSLRQLGRKIAAKGAAGSVLLLVDRDGTPVEWFEVWTRQWLDVRASEWCHTA